MTQWLHSTSYITLRLYTFVSFVHGEKSAHTFVRLQSLRNSLETMGDEITAVDEPKTPPQKLWTKKNVFLLISISYANFTLGTCYSLPAPFFPHEAEKKGATPTIYGLVFGVFQLVNLIMSPTWGKIMPHLVPRFVLITGMFVAGSCSVLFGILEFSPAGVPYITLAFCVRIVESIGVTAYITTCYGLLPILFPGHTAVVFSTMETLFGFGLIAGPTVGGALYQIGGFYLPFVVMGGCLAVGAILTSVTFMGRDEPPQEKTGSAFKMLSSTTLIMDILIFVAGNFCIGYNDATLEPHLRQFNLKPAVLGAIFIIPGGIYAFTGPVFGYFIDKGVKPHLFCLSGSILCLLCYLFIGPVPFIPIKTSMPLNIVALILLGFGLAASSISAFMHGMKDILARGFPDNVSTYALYTGIIVACAALGSFAGPSVGGFLLDHVGYENGTIFVVAIQVILVILICLNMARESVRSRNQVPPNSTPVDPQINAENHERTPLLRSTEADQT